MTAIIPPPANRCRRCSRNKVAGASNTAQAGRVGFRGEIEYWSTGLCPRCCKALFACLDRFMNRRP